MSARLGCVIVTVDGCEEGMNALRWAIDDLKLRPSSPDSLNSGHIIILHVQSPPSIAARMSPDPIPFGGPSGFEVPAFTAAVEAHQRRITEAIFAHALQICSEKKDVFGERKQFLLEPSSMSSDDSKGSCLADCLWADTLVHWLL